MRGGIGDVNAGASPAGESRAVRRRATPALMGTPPIEGKGNVENGVARSLCPRGQNEKRRAHYGNHETVTVRRAVGGDRPRLPCV